MEKIDKKLDARGLSCPMPIVKLSQVMKDMQIGEVIEVLASDHSFIPDVQAWCHKTEQVLLKIDEERDLIRAYIKKNK